MRSQGGSRCAVHSDLVNDCVQNRAAESLTPAESFCSITTPTEAVSPTVINARQDLPSTLTAQRSAGADAHPCILSRSLHVWIYLSNKLNEMHSRQRASLISTAFHLEKCSPSSQPSR
ncbi:hypothetical protein SCP_0302350 [Sparassis crispa]|uniref:Uncharacterized protein n=1 Tax=Sparassis crispa TaxID=139825 RepID=A0A401GEB8_9APHY|nr:hypothetical protein SCP_0302350 [Sparassis crispa]GBE80520.1 hypothetical protein SCP_0302350 [Sparassis crispa]